jgi:hypothetical protein
MNEIFSIILITDPDWYVSFSSLFLLLLYLLEFHFEPARQILSHEQKLEMLCTCMNLRAHDLYWTSNKSLLGLIGFGMDFTGILDIQVWFH